MQFEHEVDEKGHKVLLTFTMLDNGAQVIAWLDENEFERIPEPKKDMTWPKGRQYQVFRDEDGYPIFIRLFELSRDDAMLLKLTWGGR